MKRLSSILGGTIAGALLLAGCASGNTNTTDNTPITLTLATFNKFGYSDAMLAQYHTLHPNVTVVQNIAATSQAAQDNMFTKLAAGSGLGDVEAVEVDWMPKLKQYSNLFVDLSTSDTKGRWLDWKSAAATVNGTLSTNQQVVTVSLHLATYGGVQGVVRRADGVTPVASAQV